MKNRRKIPGTPQNLRRKAVCYFNGSRFICVIWKRYFNIVIKNHHSRRMAQSRSPGPQTKRGKEKVSNYWEERMKLNYLQMEGGWMRNRPFFKDDFWRKKRYLISVGQDALSKLQKTSQPEKHYPLIEHIIGRIIDVQNSELWIKQFEARKGKQRTCK